LFSNQYKKFSEVCHLDNQNSSDIDTYFVNEAFTFEPLLSAADLTNLSLEFELISNSTKDPIGKLRVDYSQDMFDNQLLNLDLLPVMSNLDKDASLSAYNQKYQDSNSQSGRSPMWQQQPQMGQPIQQDTSRVMSVESLNSNGARQRRKLPQMPPAKQLPQIPQGRLINSPSVSR
jgi:hypothetical protein